MATHESRVRDIQLWSTGILLVTSAALFAAVVLLTGGTFVYPLDDPAIHLTVARRLAYDGTWGIVAGEYQAASSAPLWTLVLAPTQWVFRGTAGEMVPLVVNLGAAIWVLRLLRDDIGGIVRAGRARLLDVAATAVVVVALLFLPGLVFTGMEHTLHMALVLAVAKAAEQASLRDRSGRSAGYEVPLVLMFMATLTRGESAFVAVGLALALVGIGWEQRRSALRGRWLFGMALGASSAVALGVVAVINLAFGQRPLPNSVLVKSFGDRGDTRRTIAGAVDRLTTDPWLVGIVLLTAVVLVLARYGLCRRATFPAVVTLVTALLHVQLAAVSSSSRYQAYIFGLGTWMLLRVVADLPAASPKVFGYRIRPAALLVLVLPLAVLQVSKTLTVPQLANGTFEQRYQVAKFLEREYRRDPIAIGELGYIGLYHEGPLTDVYGLGDFDVLEASLADHKDVDFWSDLQERRGFRVVATYDFALRGEQPDEWISVAEWRSPDLYYEVTRFWATEPQEVRHLQEKLREYEAQLPANVEVSYNELAVLAAANRIAESDRGG